VTRSVVVRWSVIVLAVLLVIGGALWTTGWWPDVDRSIELSNRFGNVQNGSAYDRAAIDLAGTTKLILPHNTIVRRTGNAGKVELFMKKTLAYSGYPTEPMSIREARKNMGCAVKLEGDALVVATFGEWDSIEGGAHIRLVALVPEGVELEQRKGLSGPDSAGREWQGQYLTKPKDAQRGYWYGPASPADGWTAVPAVPDPDHRAK
jgi:hypothetical protein